MRHFIWATIVSFFSGVAVSSNLSILIPINESFSAAWWKVGLLITIAIFVGAVCWNKIKDGFNEE
jgi:hypothetical protein